MKKHDYKFDKKEVQKEEIKKAVLDIHEKEDNAVIVNVKGWRMRVYLEEGFQKRVGLGNQIEVVYTGDLEDPHSVKFEKLK